MTGVRFTFRVLGGMLVLLGAAAIVPAAEPNAGGAEVDFDRDIRPLFAQKCVLCHGPDDAQAGLRLDVKRSAFGGLDSGNHGIVPGNPQRSEIMRRITAIDPDVRMPPDSEPLSRDEVDRIRRWIGQGAPWQVHWAFRPLSVPAPPEVKHRSWVRDPIDFFVLARLEAADIEPSPEADRYVLIKRLYYDLLGLPPSPEAVDEFIADRAPDAYAKLVDRLLASPHFGERWGRHWLDKARYADSDGYEKDNARPNAWRYRDWVIDAINADMPFDQFTIRQLAGDLLPDATPEDRLATAFNRQTLTNTEGGTDQEQWRVAAVMDRTETLGTVWLGLTVGCARCHSHKYDPITQQEYYQLFAFFDNGDETTTDILKSEGARAAYEAEMHAHADAVQKLEKRLAANAGAAKQLEKELEKLRKTAPKSPTMVVRVLSERTKSRRRTHVLRRGDFQQPLDEVRPATLSILTPLDPDEFEGTPDRLALARWLVHRDHPLTPRVTANHIWRQLFGEGLVRTMNDFGVRGQAPSHPDLLDHLASEYVRGGWSRKSMIRYVVMSATYRQASQHRPALLDLDPTNTLLYRQNRFRVEAEIMRDIALGASGLLDRTIGGPSVFPPIPQSVTDLTYNSSFRWVTSPGGDRYRRGMYTFFKRTAPHPNLVTFDCPDSNVANVQRNRSNTPIGALVTLNNPVYVEAAQALAHRVLSSQSGSDRDRMTRAFRLCVVRPPGETELVRLTELLQAGRSWYHDHTDEAAKMRGEFAIPGVTAAESAAWVAAVRIVMNLDEFITRE